MKNDAHLSEAKEKFEIKWKEWEATCDRKMKTYLRNVPLNQRGAFYKAWNNNSFTNAIKAKCLDCTCWQPVEVKSCTATTCPLWSYRPYQSGADKSEIGEEVLQEEPKVDF